MSAVALQTHFAPAATSGRAALLERFFVELERSGINYVTLHSYEHLPHEIVGSDLDLAVCDADLPKLPAVIASIARAAGWLIAQHIEHELFAHYSVLIDPSDATEWVALDVCSHYATGGALLVRDAVLLKNRHRAPGGFFVPAAAAEFIYLLAKSVAKSDTPGKRAQRLAELAAEDPAGAQVNFTSVFGASGSLGNWLDGSPNEWRALAAKMRARNRYDAGLRCRELRRRISRALRPTGLHIAFLGPDGSGKSTLVARVTELLAPCFSRHRVFRFRPDLLNQIKPGLQATPHDRAPRSRLVSYGKVLFYFADWWIGRFVRLLPERRCGTLLIFDRDFNDLAVDQRRYLVQGVAPLVNFLRRIAPRADATFILEGDPRALHGRKPELPVDELERQRAAFRRLADGDRRMHIVSADQPSDEVARQVTRTIIELLAHRGLRRSVPFSKRLFDIVVASLALVILSPLLALIALLIRLNFGSPVLFRQERPGLGGRPFTIRKFRTMPDVRDANGRMLPDAERLTTFGKILRSTSLDELPELVNVLRGEMSLVGPRPLLMRYLPLYSAEQMRRHDVLPGVTGWAQVNGRNSASWPQKFALDLWYVDNHSLGVDLKIIALTFWKVVKREGINQRGGISSDYFRGNGGAQPVEAKGI